MNFFGMPLYPYDCPTVLQTSPYRHADGPLINTREELGRTCRDADRASDYSATQHGPTCGGRRGAYAGAIMRSLPSLSLVAAALLSGAALGPAAADAAPWQPGQVSSVRPGEGAPARSAGNMDRTDRKFTEAAAQTGWAEIAAGRLALQRSRDPGVRDYAQRLIADHQAANEWLQRIAGNKGLAVPNGPSPQQQRELRALQRSPARDFDKDFLEQMARDHQKAVDLFGHEVKGRHQDAELKDFAQQTLVRLERHLGMAASLQKGSGHLPG